MEAGRIVQQGAPEDVWRSPATPFVARFLGLALVAASVRGGVASTPLGRVDVPLPDGTTTIALLPGAIVVAAGSRGAPAEVLSSRFAADRELLTVAVDRHGPVEVAVPLGTSPPPGTTIRIAIDPTRVAPLPAPPSGP